MCDGRNASYCNCNVDKAIGVAEGLDLVYINNDDTDTSKTVCALVERCGGIKYNGYRIFENFFRYSQ